MAQYEILSERTPVSMHEDWFDIANTDHFWMQWRFQFFIKLIKDKISVGTKILEIGCGPGTFREQFELYYNIPVDGCDLNTNALNIAKRGMGKLLLYNIFDKLPNLQKKYDSIFLMDVIEHIEDDVIFLKAAATHGKPGSLIFINVPAGMYLFSKYDIEVGHKRRYNKQSLKTTISNAGLEIVTLNYWATTLIPIGLLRRLILMVSITNKNTIKDGFKPPGKLADNFLRLLKSVELRFPFTLPIGASIFAIAKIPD